MSRREIVQVLECLRPFDIEGMQKTRAGRKCDGGYVIAKDFDEIGAVYSFGIGQEVSFDLEFSAIGIPVYQFDHTVDPPANPHGKFLFERKGIAAISDGSSDLATLSQLLGANGHADRHDLLLKLDVEGSEIEVLRTIEPATLACFRQIVLELHWLSRLGDDTYRASLLEALRHLNSAFTLCHVHANNHCGLHFIDGLVVADVLELTYVRSELVRRRPSTTVYPTSLDFPNWPNEPDHLLWFFPFLPCVENVDIANTLQHSLRNADAARIDEARRALQAELARLHAAAEHITATLAALEEKSDLL